MEFELSPRVNCSAICFTILAAFTLSPSRIAKSAEPAKLLDPIVKIVDFRDLKLLDALGILSEQTGLNMVASSEAAKTPVSMTLRNVPAKTAVEAICKANNLWFKDDNGILRVMTAQEFQRDLTTFREEQTEVFTLLYPNALSSALAIRDLYGDRVLLSLGTEERTDMTDELTERLNRFDVIDQRASLLGTFNNGSGSGGVSTFNGGVGTAGNGFSGLTSSTYNSSSRGVYQQSQQNGQRRRDETTDSKGYRDELSRMTPDDLQALKTAQQAGDTAAVELIMRQYRRKQSDIYVTLSRRNNLVAVRTGDQKALEEIGKLVRRLDVPTPVVLLEVKVMTIDLGKDMNSAFDFQFSNGVGTAGGFNTGDIQQPPSDFLKGAARKAAPLALGGTGLNAGNLAFQYVDKNFRARLQALEDKNKATTLATPVLMTANNEVSRLFVGDEQPIVQGVSSNTVVNQVASTTSSNTPIVFRPVGTTLLITPNINADRTVTLRILQENSTVNHNGATIPIITNNGSVQQQPVDVVATRSVSGTVVAQDGLTLAIGGLIEENISDVRAQVPLLGNIPGIGVIFRRQSKNKTRSELVILIRPHILTTPSEGETVSKELLEQLSIHPKAKCPEGTLGLFGPCEVLPNEKGK
ncbi:MAG TPA: hypothetical protein VKX17_07405 [Planctomycetota bacterium]|nr:hypothetical protein [Planctomycetota bacterium]